MVWNGTSPSQRLKYAALLAENVKKDATQTPLPDDPTDLNSKFDFEQHHTPKLSVDTPLRIPFPTDALALCLCQQAMLLSEEVEQTAKFHHTFRGSNRMRAATSLSIYALMGFPDSSLDRYGFNSVSLLPAPNHDTPSGMHRLDHLRQKLNYRFDINRVIRYPSPTSLDQTLPHIYACAPSISYLRPQLHGILWQDFSGTGQIYLPWCIYSFLAPNTPLPPKSRNRPS
ncbi:hypothetical protein TrST_g3693 [Triparma strigata]|uniref:Uncharacterized protein n=1 Tax=Triparma strigata TaxID=1606541 RepID=A0A9W6ZI06_9STRA|nr:hypothetical protein TrST_g3693 [Triparma strigata]